MNVLPVLADLSPSLPDSHPVDAGSSMGEFARILDRTLSGTAQSGGGTTADPAAGSTAPYVSPTEQEPAHSTSSSEEGAQPAQPQGSESKAPSSVNRQGGSSSAATTASKSSSGQATTATSSAPITNGEEQAAIDAAAKSGVARKSQKNAEGSGNGRSNDKAALETSTAGRDAHSLDAFKIAEQNDSKHSKEQTKKKSTGATQSADVSVLTATLFSRTESGKAVSGTNAEIEKTAVALLEEGGSKKGSTNRTAQAAKQTTESAPQPNQTKKGGRTNASRDGAASPSLDGKSVEVAMQLGAGAGTHHQDTTTNTVTVNSLPGAEVGQSNISNDSGNAAVVAQQGAQSNNQSLTVIDLRHPEQNSSSSTNTHDHTGQSQQGANIRLFQLADAGSTVGSRLIGQGSMVRAGGTPMASQSFSAFADQIVKQTGILLRDNNSGEIRLVLKPEKLGNLRIKIDMNNNSLTGRILVQNHDALRLVQQNLASLYRALRDSGFTSAELNVSLGGKEGGAKDRERYSPLPSARAIAGIRGLEGQMPTIETAGGVYSLVNLVI